MSISTYNSQNIINNLVNVVGKDSIITNKEQKKPYETDWRNQFYGPSIAIIFPNSTSEIIQIIKLCNNLNICIIPQGGNTSMCGGATPNESDTRPKLIINLARMNKIIELDKINSCITVESGCTLAQVANYTSNYNLLFPLSIASEESCQIGGNIATNAGGLHVVKYGSMRNLVLGLEAVLPNGQIINQLQSLRKNNTNFDLKQLFIGSEGTLGVITKATLSLYPKPITHFTCLTGVSSITQALSLFNKLKQQNCGISVFEIINKSTQDIYNTIFNNSQSPITNEWLILFEIELFEFDIQNPQKQTLLHEEIITILQNQNIDLNNVIIATNEQERSKIWFIRKNIPIAEKATGSKFIKYDIALPISRIKSFIEINAHNLNKFKQLKNIGFNLIIFGHMGDGNLHYNIQFTTNNSIDINLVKPLIDNIVYGDLDQHQGTFSAEHGIGQLKIDLYKKFSDESSFNIARSIKYIIDPQNIFNPQNIFES